MLAAQFRDYLAEHSQRIPRAIGLTLFKIRARLRHGVGDVRQAEYRGTSGTGKGIQCGGFHLDSKDASGPCRLDGFRCLTERCIGSPACPDDTVRLLSFCGASCFRNQLRIGNGKLRGRW